MRKWNCTSCGRSNATEVALDGSVKCDYCVDVMKIQPSGALGGETPDQLSAFIQADVMSRQGEWASAESVGAGALGDAALATGDNASRDRDLREDLQKRESLDQMLCRTSEVRSVNV